jgi:hypothetical protein
MHRDFIQLNPLRAIRSDAGAELIDQNRNVVPLGFFKQQRRPPGLSLLSALRNPVRDFSNFKNRIHFGLDPFQFAGAFKRSNPFS